VQPVGTGQVDRASGLPEPIGDLVPPVNFGIDLNVVDVAQIGYRALFAEIDDHRLVRLHRQRHAQLDQHVRPGLHVVGDLGRALGLLVQIGVQPHDVIRRHQHDHRGRDRQALADRLPQ
jgi:hypothetical protein